MTSATHRDPRSIITPDAFEVSADLIGMPLAAPRRRAAALLIDGLVIAFITAVTKSFALILGVVAAAFFMRAGFKRTKVRGNVFGRAMRTSVGCLGFFIAIVTASLWSAFGVDFNRDDGPNVAKSIEDSGVAAQVLTALVTAGATDVFEDAETLAEAEEVAREFIAGAQNVGLGTQELRSLLLRAVPDDAAWRGDADALVNRLLPAPSDEERAREGSLTAQIAAYDIDETLEAYRALRSSDAPDPDSDAGQRTRLLETRLSGFVAADTLGALEQRIQALEGDVAARQRALDDRSDELERATRGGVFGWLRDRADDLGFGFGWAALYMTVFLSWWNGQTVGKRVMRLRVVRLDGEPITWWVAFERAGGYAAGLATGLLGFAQVWWDSNRQAIHDRIVGTVVVVEGGKKVSDWESVL